MIYKIFPRRRDGGLRGGGRDGRRAGRRRRRLRPPLDRRAGRPRPRRSTSPARTGCGCSPADAEADWAGAALGAVARRRAVPASLPRAAARRRGSGRGRLPPGRTGARVAGRAGVSRLERLALRGAARARPRDRARPGAAGAARGARAARRAGRRSPRLAASLAGLALPNPLGLAAGFDKNAVAVGAAAARRLRLRRGRRRDAAAAARQPAAAAVPAGRGPAPSINRFGFNNDGVEAIAARLAAPRPPGVVGVNLGANKDERRPGGRLRRGAGARPGRSSTSPPSTSPRPTPSGCATCRARAALAGAARPA